VIPHDKAIEPEGVTRNRSIDSSSALRVVYFEGLPVSAPTNFVLFASPHEIVPIGIEREQHPEVPLWVDVKHE
jgi:hypothetical protein